MIHDRNGTWLKMRNYFARVASSFPFIAVENTGATAYEQQKKLLCFQSWWPDSLGLTDEIVSFHDS